jgi:hypothetical protein
VRSRRSPRRSFRCWCPTCSCPDRRWRSSWPPEI